jgi:cysteinyl-tRNA synthetase
LCDKLRDEDLVDLGVALDDQPGTLDPFSFLLALDQLLRVTDGTALVKLVPRESLISAREEKRAAAAAKAAKAEEKRRQAEQAAQTKAAEAAKELELGKTPPSEWFRLQSDKWSAWDEEGFPTADKEGEPVTKSGAKRLKKELEVQTKRHEKYLKSLQS